MSFGGKWGDLEWFHDQYECVRGVLKKDKYLDKDIGDIQDKFFVFADDCKPLNPPVINPYFPDLPYLTEWNLLSNWPGLRTPMTQEAAEVWNKRKLNYTQAIEKVKNTIRDESYLKII